MSDIRIEESRILFASLSLPEFPTSECLRFLQGASEMDWIYDSYRDAKILPLMTSTGGADIEAMKAQCKDSSQYQWTKHAPPQMKDYFDQHMWNWLGTRARMSVFRTAPGHQINEHIDCSKEAHGSIQLKLRFVLQGRSDSLYFIHEGGRFFAPETRSFFLIDGSWPHGMVNSERSEKYTLCLGAPWVRALEYPAFESVVSKDSFQKPRDFKKYFQENRLAGPHEKSP